MNLMETLYWNFKTEIKDIQGVLLPDRQTLRGDSRHENKHLKWETMERKRLL